jgi:hypothetical protein
MLWGILFLERMLGSLLLSFVGTKVISMLGRRFAARTKWEFDVIIVLGSNVLLESMVDFTGKGQTQASAEPYSLD